MVVAREALPGAVEGQALGLMALAMLIAPGMDVLAKLATESVSPATAVLGRFAAQTALLVPLALALGETGRPGWLHLVAGACFGAALLCITAAVAVMPVANAIAIFFVEPLVLTLLSAAILGERLGVRRLAACGVGLAGALVVLRPNVAAYGPEAVLPIGAAVFFALYLVATRVIARRGARFAMQLWTGLAGAGVVALGMAGQALLLPDGVLAQLAPTWPDGRALALFAAMGALAVGAHQLLALAISRVEAGALAPLQYLEIIGATALGWMVFGDFPDAMTWAGTAVIVAAGLYVYRRERRLAATGGIA